jgi:CDP-glycerol glycerophosphotransferase
MATFSFESGNLRALRSLPFYVLGAVAALIVPRTNRVWVFGSGVGLGEGALPLMKLAREQLGADVRVVWLATTPAELRDARARGFDAVAKQSRRGLWLTLRARVLVVTHGMGDVNRYGVRGGFIVQLWHGIPLKRLHLDSPAALRAPSFLPAGLGHRVMAFAYGQAGRQIQLFPVSSARLVTRISSAFGIPPDRIAITGDPRDDVLSPDDPADRRERARQQLAELVGPVPPTVVMYAPTWRDGDTDPSIPDEDTWQAIAAWLERTDSVLIVRTHPLGRGDYTAGTHISPRVRLLDAVLLADVTPVLPAVDALVTDYSSIAFDYALVGGPVVFLAPDVTSYTATRGLYEPYRLFSGGRDVVSWSHALAQLDSPAELAAARNHADWLRNEYFDHADGQATARVLAEIRHRTGQGAAATSDNGTNRPRVVRLHIADDRLNVEFAAEVPDAISLVGSRASVEGVIDGTTVTFALLVTRWGSPGLALPSGGYRLTVQSAPASTRVTVAAAEHLDVMTDLYRAKTGGEDGGLVVRIGPPLRDGESGQHATRAQRLAYVRPRRRLENAVYFESFYGRAASCNPLAIDRVLARTHPDVRRYWSVADGSVAIPDGAIRIVEGSPEWWRVRAEARVYVINDWLRWTYRPRRHQHVLQTWHGTMLKRLALDRPDMSARRRFATTRQGWRWNALLAQNYYSARIFRTSYAFRGPIWETGYPRNDVFIDPDRADSVRAAVGIAPNARVVLYAPTWRDDRDEMVDYLDLVNFADELPDDHVLLVRGHSRTLAFGQDLQAERLVDVTSYPDVADLMLVADVLVTDYSSVMFDFAATEKPMVFFTPDLAHYQDVLRGFYFDLIADAPGPVVSNRADLLDAIRNVAASEAHYRARRDSWREKFAPHDDGHAGERVVARMYEAGWLG